jgi:hypothetical protein
MGRILTRSANPPRPLTDTILGMAPSTVSSSFFDVPARDLELDGSVGAGGSPKGYSRDEIRNWMTAVPKAYELAEHEPMELARICRAPGNELERSVRDVWTHIFEPGSSTPLRASLNKETGKLEVMSGQHRVRAAQELGIERIPVHIFASDADIQHLMSRYRSRESRDQERNRERQRDWR